jgi:branched-chain amino acid transport system substrate-binding protein
MSFTRRSVNMGLAAGLATSAFSPIARAGGDTIKIGMVPSVTGPGADSGKYAVTGQDRPRAGQQIRRRARQTG